jgi:hypothetical protein
MKKVNYGAVAFSALLAFFLAVICINALDYKPRVRLVPMLIGIISLVICLLVLVNEIHPLPMFGKSETGPTHSPDQKKKENGRSMISPRMWAIIFWMIGFVALTFLVGFYISIAVFCFAFLKFQEKVGSLKSFLVTAGVWGFIFVVFKIIMDLYMFEGILFGAILPKL